ncbi:SGNH hydrolase-type esterase domain-containing protein [Auriculariales sp. MPI-PUGE-AT-0066]|nr:SGNH hydrolase-type esterase domain-containing protein [Auriculariales sp. MPI-PUGE-AT-0066]
MLLSLLLSLSALVPAAFGLNGQERAHLHSRRAVKAGIPGGHWVDTWVSMPQLTEPGNLAPAPFNRFVNSTIRQTLHLSIGGSQLRVRISNAFGTVPLPISAVTIALPANNTSGISAIKPETLKTVTFSGQSSFVLPNAALLVSDPIDFTVKPQTIISVSIYLAVGQASDYITSHPGSRTTSFWANGDSTSAEDLLITDAATQSAAHWYFLSAVEVWAPITSRGLAVVGDSITDGRGSDPNANNRWPDLLLARMQKNALTSSISVLNQAAGGNRILADGLGPNALSRIERDVLSHSGVRYAMIFEGVNDLGTANPTSAEQAAVVSQLKGAFTQIAVRVRTFGIPLFGATITPFGSPNSTLQPYSHPVREQARLDLNNWIRTSGVFDAVIDFDAMVRDPANATQLNPLYDSGDQLHLNPAGYQAMADGFPLAVFTEYAFGVTGFD